MGFGCTIITKDGELTGFNKPGKINYQCHGLSYPDSPYNIMDLREELCWNHTITGTHAQYVFERFQRKVIENIAALQAVEHPDCPNCQCKDTRELLEGMKIVASIKSEDIISIEGGY